MLRRAPRLSIGQLAEYMVASPRRKRAIILGAIAPRDYVVNHHRRARSAIIWACRRGEVDGGAVDRAIERLASATPRNDRDKADIENSISAIRSFPEVAAKINFGSAVRRPHRRTAYMAIEGVAVSVQPSLIIRAVGDEEEKVGALHLHLAKTHALREDAANYMTTLLRYFLLEGVEGRQVAVDPALCQVADVFAGEVYTAPSSYKKRMKNVATACEMVRRLWPSYLGDFDGASDEDFPGHHPAH